MGFNLSEKMKNADYEDRKSVREFIKLLDDGCVDCPEFRAWEDEQPTHYIRNTNELERFIMWFKSKKLNKLTGDKLTI